MARLGNTALGSRVPALARKHHLPRCLDPRVPYLPPVLVTSRKQGGRCSLSSVLAGLGQSQKGPPGSICLSETSVLPWSFLLLPLHSLLCLYIPEIGGIFCHTLSLAGKVPILSPLSPARSLVPRAAHLRHSSHRLMKPFCLIALPGCSSNPIHPQACLLYPAQTIGNIPGRKLQWPLE